MQILAETRRKKLAIGRKKRLNNFNNGFRGGVIAFSATSLLPFAGGGQSAVEEFGGRAVGADPIAPAEQVVNLAWRRVESLNCYIVTSGGISASRLNVSSPASSRPVVRQTA